MGYSFDWKITGLKAFLAALFAAGLQEIALQASTGAFTELALQSDWRNLGIAVAVAFWRAGKNMVKNNDLNGNPLRNLLKTWMLFLLIPALTLPGCVTATPAFGGKTTYKMDFVDATAEQNTEFHVDISAPAGVEIQNLASMAYKWHPDGSGNIAVAGDTAADTTAQAAMLTEVNAQQLEFLKQLASLITSIMPLLHALSPAPAPVAAP
jgi:hypothetical protein